MKKISFFIILSGILLLCSGCSGENEPETKMDSPVATTISTESETVNSEKTSEAPVSTSVSETNENTTETSAQTETSENTAESTQISETESSQNTTVSSEQAETKANSENLPSSKDEIVPESIADNSQDENPEIWYEQEDIPDVPVILQENPNNETPVISNHSEEIQPSTEARTVSETQPATTVQEETDAPVEQEEIPIVTEGVIEFPFIPIG